MGAAKKGENLWGVLLLFCVMVAYLLIRVAPRFDAIFSDMLNGSPLPALTSFIMGMSRWMCNYWWLVAIVLLILLILGKFLFPASLRNARLHLPIWAIVFVFGLILAGFLLALYLPMLSIIDEMNNGQPR